MMSLRQDLDRLGIVLEEARAMVSVVGVRLDPASHESETDQ
jgi:hypothetical protein